MHNSGAGAPRLPQLCRDRGQPSGPAMLPRRAPNMLHPGGLSRAWECSLCDLRIGLFWEIGRKGARGSICLLGTLGLRNQFCLQTDLHGQGLVGVALPPTPSCSCFRASLAQAVCFSYWVLTCPLPACPPGKIPCPFLCEVSVPPCRFVSSPVCLSSSWFLSGLSPTWH